MYSVVSLHRSSLRVNECRPREVNLERKHYVITALLCHDTVNERKYSLFVSGAGTTLYH